MRERTATRNGRGGAAHIHRVSEASRNFSKIHPKARLSVSSWGVPSPCSESAPALACL